MLAIHTCRHTSLASITVPTPTVRACVGTCDLSPPKNLALEIIVSWAKVLTRVRDTREEPGSLKAMWPSAPIPANVERMTSVHRSISMSCSHVKLHILMYMKRQTVRRVVPSSSIWNSTAYMDHRLMLQISNTHTPTLVISYLRTLKYHVRTYCIRGSTVCPGLPWPALVTCCYIWLHTQKSFSFITAHGGKSTNQYNMQF